MSLESLCGKLIAGERCVCWNIGNGQFLFSGPRRMKILDTGHREKKCKTRERNVFYPKLKVDGGRGRWMATCKKDTWRKPESRIGWAEDPVGDASCNINAA